jgi:beta-lactamase superfamily II metal-dependent hydrolase
MRLRLPLKKNTKNHDKILNHPKVKKKLNQIAIKRMRTKLDRKIKWKNNKGWNWKIKSIKGLKTKE